MAISNRERVDRALNLLCQGLYPYLKQEMQGVYSNSWEKEAKSCLPKHKPLKQKSADSILSEDVAMLLLVMSKQWDKVFNEKLNSTGNGLVTELIQVRNGGNRCCKQAQMHLLDGISQTRSRHKIKSVTEKGIKRTARNMEILTHDTYDRNQLRREQHYEHHISRKRRGHGNHHNRTTRSVRRSTHHTRGIRAGCAGLPRTWRNNCARLDEALPQGLAA
jgi:hypothetical protein